jgi:heterodisulfide reductase subunit A
MDEEKENANCATALVIGAGIGGIKSSIDLAESGFEVYLLDEAPFIGGTLSLLDRQFPTNDCGMCKMLPSFSDEFCSDLCLRRSLDHPNIHVITNAKVIDLVGEPGKFLAKVNMKARMVDEEKCIACDKCVEVCPVEVENEFNEELGKRKAIFIRYPSAVPNIYAIDTVNCTKCEECVKICPTNAIDLSEQDEEKEICVGAVILALGFVPYDPQEIGAYHYGEYQNVLTALQFERLISGTGPDMNRGLIRITDNRIPEKIAFLQCVGSRDEKNNYCSSACCMHSLKEAMMVKELYPDIEIKIMFMDMRTFGKGYHRYYEDAKKIGIIFERCRAADLWEDSDKNITVNYVDESDVPTSEVFEMAVLATGQNPPKNAMDLSRALGIELNEYGFCRTKKDSAMETTRPGIFSCGSFSEPKDIPDTMMEASAAAAMAGTLLRNLSGIEEKGEEKELDPEAVENQSPNIGILICHCGDELERSLHMSEILNFSKSLSDVTFAEDIDYLCLKLDEVGDKLKEAGVGKVIFAACAPYPFEVKFKKALASSGINPRLLEIVNLREGCAWSHDDIKMATEKAKAQVAMAHGKLRIQEFSKASLQPVIQRALILGGGISGMTSALTIAGNGYPVDIVELHGELGGNARQLYHTLDGLDIQDYLKSLVKEVEKNKLITVYKNSEVTRVSGRAGDFLAVIKTAEDEIMEKYGVVILATGALELTPKEYLYGEHENVITQIELEKRIAEGNMNPSSITMIQCVGLREDERRYCGRICCSQSLKNALKIKDAHPNTIIHILYQDMMSYGFSEKYYIKAKEAGVNFIRYESQNKPEVKVEGKKLKVELKDLVLDEELLIQPDLVVLSAGPVPENNEYIKEIFDLELGLDEDGFFSEANVKFRPVDFLGEGIFVCGMAHSPRNLYESITQAQGAAGRALTILSKNELSSARLVSEVKDRWCVGCEACITACPYDARILDKDRKVAKVVDVICKGCGVCAVVCPSGAAKLKELKDEQIMAMIDEAVI